MTAGARSVGIGCRLPVRDTRPIDKYHCQFATKPWLYTGAWLWSCVRALRFNWPTCAFDRVVLLPQSRRDPEKFLCQKNQVVITLLRYIKARASVALARWIHRVKRCQIGAWWINQPSTGMFSLVCIFTFTPYENLYSPEYTVAYKQTKLN